MDENSPLLPTRHQESIVPSNPNLSPRHGDLLPTPCGPIKKWSELSLLMKIYFCFTLISMLGLFIVIVVHISKIGWKSGSDNDDLTLALIQLVGIVFCVYYISRGILQENRQELIVFLLTVLVVMVRSVVNFSVPKSYDPVQTVQFVCIVCVGFLHLIFSALLIRRSNLMAFRVGGALESMQRQYSLLNFCFSMVTFDLQDQLCLCILILTSGPSVSYTHTIILEIGIVWAIITAVVGAFAVLKEVKLLVWAFLFLNLPQVAYFCYLLYSIISDWGKSKTYLLEAAAITGCVISGAIKIALLCGLYQLYRSFGQGLRERMFASDNR